MITIFGRATSINVRKVLWACAELDIAFEREDWGTGFRSTELPEFLDMNPNGMVPVIRDRDFVLWESNSILRYLSTENDGALLYPAKPRDRARIDQWIDWQASDLNKSWSYAFLSLVRNSPAHQDPPEVAASTAVWTKYMTVLDKQLEKTGSHVVGDTFTLADIPIGLSVHRWFSTPLAHPVLPAVSAYSELLTQRAGFLNFGRNGVP